MQTPFGGSKFKTVPYLFVHSRQTEGEVVFGGYGEVDPRGSGTYSNTVSYAYTYDEYCLGNPDGYSTGPALDYWWKMQYNGTEINYGSKGSLTGTLVYVQHNASSYSASSSTVVKTTVDNKSVKFTGFYYNRYQPAIFWPYDQSMSEVSKVITVGGWYDFSNNTNTGVEDQQRIFSSNLGGRQGYYRGFMLYVPSVPTGGLNIIFALGSPHLASQSNRRYTTPDINWNVPHFVAARVSLQDCEVSITSTSGYTWAQVDINSLSFSLFIDGVEQSLSTLLTGTGTSVVIGCPQNSDFNGWAGMGFESPGDLIGLGALGYRDELFVHLGNISNQQLARMYELGTQEV